MRQIWTTSDWIERSAYTFQCVEPLNVTFFFPVFSLLPPYRINETLRSKINLTMLLKTSIGLVQIVNLPNIQVSGFPKLTSPSLHFFFKTQHWALICHSIGAKIYQDLKSIERYRTCLDYLFIINQNSSACFYSKQNSIVTLEFRLNLHSISGTNLPYK